jgi:hypothetical protein
MFCVTDARHRCAARALLLQSADVCPSVCVYVTKMDPAHAFVGDFSDQILHQTGRLCEK